MKTFARASLNAMVQSSKSKGELQFPAGGDGRHRGSWHIAVFLSWRVNKLGVPARWMSSEGEDRDALIGTAVYGDDVLKPPVKPDHLTAFLDG